MHQSQKDSFNCMFPKTQTLFFKHCHEMTGLQLWIGTYCVSCVVQQTSRVKDLSSLVRYDDSCLAAIRHVQSMIRIVRPRPNIRSQASCLQIILVKRVNFSKMQKMLTHAHSEIVQASPGRSSRIRHRNALTERAWKDAEQGLGKTFLFIPGCQLIRFC